MTVYKSPTCGCCAKWIEHVQKNGFTTKVVETQDMRGGQGEGRHPTLSAAVT